MDGDISTAVATLAPSPNLEYQIQPKAVYHIAAGETFQVGQLVKVEMVGNSLAVDSVVSQTNDVTLIHDDSNTK
ncbi:hypothetical protein QQZ08_001349 [Neonectria magnoliae]|uniref:Uncharacterized protein n=1 Tax=Neonectria magnoliae TaxID=2732573 RepID=A0ABR1IFI2_9HYPO